MTVLSVAITLACLAATLLPTATVTSSTASVAVTSPRCPSLFAWIRDPNDCARFWRCNWGAAVLMPRCPSGTVLSQRFLVCVHSQGVYDDCAPLPTAAPETQTATYYADTPSSTPSSQAAAATTSNTTLPTPSVWLVCSRNLTALAPHDSECQLFYNCSLQDEVVPRTGLGERYLAECQHPLLYDVSTQSCRPASLVNCHNRTWPNNYCEYRSNLCSASSSPATSGASLDKSTQVSASLDPFPLATTTYASLATQVLTSSDPFPSASATGASLEVSTQVLTSSDPFPSTTSTGASLDVSTQVLTSSDPFPSATTKGASLAAQVLTPSDPFPSATATGANLDVSTQELASLVPLPSTSSLPSSVEWIKEYCERNMSGLTSHPAECQLYFNCSHVYHTVPEHFQQYLQECQYPLLYDVPTQRCLDFTLVDCQQRRMAIGPCDYRQYYCSNASCTPCEKAFPSCQGVGDGVKTLGAGIQWSAAYLTCRNGRALNVSQCAMDNHLLVPMVFSPTDLQCVNMYQVPREAGGLRPVCAGQSDGPHPEENGRLDLFFMCLDGQYNGIYKCPRPRPIFDSSNNVCREGDMFIGLTL